MLKHATIARTNRAQQSSQLQKQWENQIQQLRQRQQQLSNELTLSSLGSRQSPPVHVDGQSNATITDRNNSITHDQQTTADSGPTPHHPQHDDYDLDDDDISSPNWLTNTLKSLQRQHHMSQSCSSSPTPSIVPQTTTPTNGRYKLSSAPTSAVNSPNKFNGPVLSQCDDASSSNRLLSSAASAANAASTQRNCSESMIKVFAQTLSQEVGYVTLHVNPQTKSSQIVRNLLKKFRLKHRDPNLFYLTLERWIRKDGLKTRSVMLLGDDACPLQLQQCCSNPPHNDIKFTMAMRQGALVKIHCSDVCPDVRYKCLSLSTQTSVDETINLMLQCLNLASSQQPQETPVRANSTSCQSTTSRLRSLAGSPGLSTDSSSTSSSSSGIESDPTNVNANHHHHHHHQATNRELDSSSRASSVTSISSSSNMSSSSVCNQLSEQYCLIIECKDANYRRILESDEYLVDVYQNLLDEVRENQHPSSSSSLLGDSISLSSSDISNHNTTVASPNTSYDLNKQQPDQWFFIKLKRREDVSQQPSIKFANPRQNMPLPPLPISLAQHNANILKHIVTTTQIEVNPQNNNLPQRNQFSCNDNKQLPLKQQQHSMQHYHRPTNSSVSCLTTIPANGNVANGTLLEFNSGTDTVDGLHHHHHQKQQQFERQQSATLDVPRRSNHVKQLSAITSKMAGSASGMPPPPDSLIWLPEVRPRRRNLSNVSTSTFGRPQYNISTGVSFNRRRYDPAQLAADLEKLDMGNEQERTSDVGQQEQDQQTFDAIESSTANGTAELVLPFSGIELNQAGGGGASVDEQ